MPARLFLLPIVSAVLFACEGTSNKAANMMLDNPIRDRQISSFDQSTLFVDITVNGGSIQTFFVPRGDSPAVGVVGILPLATNTMDIRWYEELGGVEINLSTQTQSFFSGGDIIIDAAHKSDQFDDDNDGVSNLDERLNGTCVWSVTTECSAVPDNRPDVFITPSFAQQGINITSAPSNTEIVFSYEKNNWSSSETVLSADELCVQMQAGIVGTQAVIAYYKRPIELGPGRYFIQYDVRVTGIYAPVNVNTTRGAPEFIADFDHYVQGTPEWMSHTVQFDIDTTNTTIGFIGLKAATETTYCLENIVLLRQS